MGLFTTGGGTNRVAAGIRKRARRLATPKTFLDFINELLPQFRSAAFPDVGAAEASIFRGLAGSGFENSGAGLALQAAVRGLPQRAALNLALPEAGRLQQLGVETELRSPLPVPQSSLFSNLVDAAGVVFPAASVFQQLGKSGAVKG